MASLCISFHSPLSFAVLCQPLGNSSLHLLHCLPLLLFPSLSVHHFSGLLIICPAQLHFRLDASLMASFSPVLLLISSFLILSRLVIPSILLSIALCATRINSCCFFVREQVVDPYVMTGRMHISNSRLLCWISIF